MPDPQKEMSNTSEVRASESVTGLLSSLVAFDVHWEDFSLHSSENKRNRVDKWKNL